jgi:hypothetical protein
MLLIMHSEKHSVCYVKFSSGKPNPSLYPLNLDSKPWLSFSYEDINNEIDPFVILNVLI